MQFSQNYKPRFQKYVQGLFMTKVLTSRVVLHGWLTDVSRVVKHGQYFAIRIAGLKQIHGRVGGCNGKKIRRRICKCLVEFVKKKKMGWECFTFTIRIIQNTLLQHLPPPKE